MIQNFCLGRFVIRGLVGNPEVFAYALADRFRDSCCVGNDPAGRLRDIVKFAFAVYGRGRRFANFIQTCVCADVVRLPRCQRRQIVIDTQTGLSALTCVVIGVDACAGHIAVAGIGMNGDIKVCAPCIGICTYRST